MSTLALKPGLHFRFKSFYPKGDHRKRRANVWHTSPSRAISAATGATALAFFCVAAPVVGDPTAGLFALDGMSTIPEREMIGREMLTARALEVTPMMLGPTITSDSLALVEAYTAMDAEAEADAVADEAAGIMRMPVLEVHARPPSDDTDSASHG